MHSTTYVLLLTAVSTAAFHTLIPDHWLPFVLIGRARRWSLARTAAVSGVSALVHTMLSVALALAALGVGIESARVLGHRLEEASAVLLISFGLVYALWAWRKGGHFHPGGSLLHRRGETGACAGAEGDGASEHLHYHADTEMIRGGSTRGELFVALIVGLNPCVLVMPILLAAADRGPGAIGAVSAAYCVTTIALMVGFSLAGVAGTRGIRIPGIARHMEAASGILIALVGFVFWLSGG